MTGLGLTTAKVPERILIVDDDDAGRYAKSRILRQAGFGVLEAAGGGDALALVESEAPDLILLDVRLPDMSGTEVCRRINQHIVCLGWIRSRARRASGNALSSRRSRRLCRHLSL